jgi:uncharacterized membrane protein YfcA
MEEFWSLTIIVILFSTVQSLFGVGLLVFGTPTLLLMGYSFEVTIAFLLPSSVTISIMQVLHGRDRIDQLRKSFLVYSVPLIVVGLVLVVREILVIDVKILVGLALVFSAITRYHKKMQQAVANLLERHSKLYLMFMGFVHGLTNMGGGFLTVMVTTLYDDKESTRANIAYGYLVFALSQIIVLLLLHPGVFSISSILLAAIALLTYFIVGNVLYVKSSRSVYQHLITVFMLAYGILLIGQKLI